jgi:AcrR family transcriptional regulator
LPDETAAMSGKWEGSVKQPANDKRVERTREALSGAFFELVLSVPYGEIKVEDIIARAGVSRSTFYEHFSGKDDILAMSVKYPFVILADAWRARDNTADLVRVLEHFWENRAIAPGIFRGAGRQVCTDALVELIEERFRQDRVGSPTPLLIPPRMAAIQLAEGLLAPITAWLLGEVPCTAQALAQGLRQTATAMLAAQRQPSLNSGAWG